MAEQFAGLIVDPVRGKTFTGEIEVAEGRILAVREESASPDCVITPPLVDAHIHIESSLLTPAQFARLALAHGVCGAVCDPHEIANVCGIDGVRFMIENGKTTPFTFLFGAPSCVPATPFETAGAAFHLEDLQSLLERDDIGFLAEMMNWPGVLSRASEEIAKIEIAKSLGKPVDGHAPGLKGEDARRYIEAGITTDHECFSAEEALDKLRSGMKVSIREGSAAKNFEALIDLLPRFPERMMFCTDDAHPNYIRERYIDDHVRRALRRGIDPIHVFSAASVNPVRHYRLPLGLLQPGDRADFVVSDNLRDFNVLATYTGGKLVAEQGKPLIPTISGGAINNFSAHVLSVSELQVRPRSNRLRAIRVIPNELITEEEIVEVRQPGDNIPASRDLLKLAVKNRYADQPAAIGFVRAFGLKRGALAGSVAHDSHNVIGIGANDEELMRAMNLVIAARGGLTLVDGSKEELLPLPVAGLMSPDDAFMVAEKYDQLDRYAREDLGCPLPSPFMSLSFLALLVIPALKLSDKGLFDGRKFEFVELFV